MDRSSGRCCLRSSLAKRRVDARARPHPLHDCRGDANREARGVQQPQTLQRLAEILQAAARVMPRLIGIVDADAETAADAVQPASSASWWLRRMNGAVPLVRTSTGRSASACSRISLDALAGSVVRHR